MDKWTGFIHDDFSFLEGSYFAPMWSADLREHHQGDLSYAAFQRDGVIQELSRVEIGTTATFVGIFDGHGYVGNNESAAAKLAFDHLFARFVSNYESNVGTAPEEEVIVSCIREAIQDTEGVFLQTIRDDIRRMVDRGPRVCKGDPETRLSAASGCSCLIGVVKGGRQYIFSVGGSRAVLGCDSQSGGVMAVRLTDDHHVDDSAARDAIDIADLAGRIPSFLDKRGTKHLRWKIKVTRSIGDLYLKSPNHQDYLVNTPFEIYPPIHYPLLTAIPSTSVRVLDESHRFVIFASRGLWDYLTDEVAVRFVQNNEKQGIAEKLIDLALKAARKKGSLLSRVLYRNPRNINTHMTVVVLFYDSQSRQVDREVSRVPRERVRTSFGIGRIRRSDGA